MGETQRHHVTHHLPPELLQAISRMAEALTELAFPAPIPMPAPEMPAPDTDTQQPHVEPWAFHSPRHGGDVVAYLDPQNQVRHVPVSRSTDVPKTWRAVYLGDPR